MRTSGAARTVDASEAPGHAACRDHVHRTVHVALVRGDLAGSPPPLVRVHLLETLRDVIGIRGEAAGWTLRGVMERIAEEPSGIVIILRQTESAREVMESVQALARGGHSQPAMHQGGTVLRTYGIGAQIIADLGVRRMRVMSAPWKLTGLAGFGLEIVEYVNPLEHRGSGAPRPAR